MDVGGYYEAKIQVRPVDEEIISYVYNQVEKDKDAEIVKVIHIQKGDGVDIYLNSWRFAVQLGRKLKKVFKCEMLVTRSLYGRNKTTSKDVYRVTVLIRIPKKDVTIR